MVLIDTLVLGSFGTNCYIVRSEGSESCAVIDPGYEPRRILDHAGKLGLKVDAVLLTHGHFDHVGGVREIVEQTGCRLYVSQAEHTLRFGPATSFYYPIAGCRFTQPVFCADGSRIDAGGVEFEVIATPGHTPGGVCLLAQDALFCGDTLFAGSCGRTDLPGGDWVTLHRSLQRLSRLDEGIRVFPGHGESSTIAREKQVNPYLQF